MSDNGSVGPTKGPWEACDPGDYGDFDGQSRIILGDDMRIAVVHWHPTINTDMSDANARLIAAAPELADAAEDAFVFLGSVDGASELRAKLMAALQKAGLSAGEGC